MFKEPGENFYRENNLSREFNDWAISSPEKAKSLEFPERFLEILIPEKAKEMASNYDNVEIIRLDDSRESLSFIVIEKNFSEEISDREEWDSWSKKINEEKQNKKEDEIHFFSKKPESVNKMHAKFREEINSGIINLSDRILMSVKIKVLPEMPEGLFVADYDGESKRGLASDFYKNNLEDFARTLGFRYILGINESKNVSFFKEKIGRFLYEDIKPEFRESLFPTSNSSTIEKSPPSVQFIYPEDKEKFVEEN